MLVAQSCPALHDTMDYSPPGSSVHGILQARILEWVAISFSSINNIWKQPNSLKPFLRTITTTCANFPITHTFLFPNHHTKDISVKRHCLSKVLYFWSLTTVLTLPSVNLHSNLCLASFTQVLIILSLSLLMQIISQNTIIVCAWQCNSCDHCNITVGKQRDLYLVRYLQFT